MSEYLLHIFSYFEAVLHPAAGKTEAQKTKRRSSKPASVSPSSPDSLNIRASVRTQNNFRRNPAP